MKKIFVSSILFFLILTTSVQAYSSGFEYMLNAMGIEQININGHLINEEIYEKYNIFVYGSPLNIKSNKQRWKEYSIGNWTLSGGAWKGVGVRGEYWILGEDYSGNLIHNEIFPDDYASGTSPLNWNYRLIKNAEESWNDTSKYQYELQHEYMLTQKLSRFGVTYDITALDIGLNKARVENYATWRSDGTIYTEKPGEGNVYWVATFSVPPMAGNAILNSVLETPNGLEYTIAKDSTQIEIPIEFGAKVEGLSEYAKSEHVKILESELKINNTTKDRISASQTIEILKNNTLVIDKNNYPNQEKIILELECNSFLATCFLNDPVMYANKKCTIIVNLESEDEHRVPIVNDEVAPSIYSCELKRITTDSRGREQEVGLYTSSKTKTKFICAGQVLKIEIKTSLNTSRVYYDFSGKESIRIFDDLTKRFEWEEPSVRGTKTRFSSLNKLQEAYNFPCQLKLEEETETYKLFSGFYVIPYGTTQTLHSWNSLREKSKNAFNIDESKLFSRKESSYRIVIKASSLMGTRTKTYPLDVAERWDELYNRDISKYIIQN